MSGFDFDLAFSRNLGWFTEQDRAVLRQKRVAIAGLGGVGGVHLLTLTRLGLGAFTLADPDVFELANFNRQAGASLSHLGRKKVEAMAAMARDINPELDLRTFPEGVDEANADEFLKDADIYVDGLDFFALDARRLVFRKCAEKGIPAVTAAPIGMGSALLNFLPGGMTFEDYFRFRGRDPGDDLIRFLVGLSPRMLHAPYLVDDTRTDFRAQRVPSTSIGCELSAGLAAAHAVKILLQRGGVPAAPRGVHLDAYRSRLVRTWRPWGNANPVQRIAIALARRRLLSSSRAAKPPEETAPPGTPAERVIELARWSPSGDNLQQWRFERNGERGFRIYGDNHSRDVYFLNDWPKLLALGGLLETVAIAATGEGLKAEFARPAGTGDTDREIVREVTLVPDGGRPPSPLLPFIRSRTTQRRSMSRRGLSPGHRRVLEEAVRPYRILWIEDPRRRWEMARLASQYARIRLTIPEAYEVHKKVIEWGQRFSTDRIPDQAIGLDPMALKLMRWAMKSWARVRFMNKYLAGTLLPRIQLELIPGRNCAAYAALLAPGPMNGPSDYLDAGRAMQRFWLTATRLGLQLQPQMAPLIFDSYAREKIAFTADQAAIRKTASLSPRLRAVLGEDNYPVTAFLARLGWGTSPVSRSLRKPLSQLLETPRK
ncbi:MAG TPA: ThiF family adenylyltransferase [bacterium]|nr:ThiF family adenylyltransferase [bacterium]